MPVCKPGDIVARHSYEMDILFRVTMLTVNQVGAEVAELKGLNVRLEADAPLVDLQVMGPREIYDYTKHYTKVTYDRVRKLTAQKRGPFSRNKEKVADEFFKVPGRVLHLDGDQEYLDECIKTYRQLEINAKGICRPEKEQPKYILQILQENPTDILVLTGHDGLLKGCKDFTRLDSYRSSRYFVESVAKARTFEPNKDSLVIFAGACQSHFEAIIQAGANFASSPQRVFIHAFDPVFIVERVAFTPIHEPVLLKEVIEGTVTGVDGVGGIETRGQLRLGYPRSPY
ncbi:MAG: sporulation peptidase YabG [Peptococcaceae bacterium]|nr:sporulation peptidase YabG [Peptococcaceae bacterium]